MNASATWRALSLTQPWATLVAIGAKKVETRSFGTEFRGRVAIQATKSWTLNDRALCSTEPFRGKLVGAGYLSAGQLPHGAVVAVATLAEVVYMGSNDAEVEEFVRSWKISPTERAFGGYGPARSGWFLKDVVMLPKAIPMQGQLGIFTLPGEVREAIERQLEAVREDREERAGIYEFDAGLSRPDAEEKAGVLESVDECEHGESGA